MSKAPSTRPMIPKTVPMTMAVVCRVRADELAGSPPFPFPFPPPPPPVLVLVGATPVDPVAEPPPPPPQGSHYIPTPPVTYGARTQRLSTPIEFSETGQRRDEVFVHTNVHDV